MQQNEVHQIESGFAHSRRFWPGVIERPLWVRADIQGVGRLELCGYQRDLQYGDRFWGPC
jgi:hypothetical protein